MADKKAKSEEEILLQAQEAFERAEEAESDNRKEALDDLKFARLDEHWPEAIKKQREQEGRPCLTIPKLPAFIRQVVNDSRQNKPSIKVHPVDSSADKDTADIISGLIRNIEYTSNADVAYDTAVESAVSAGFGYFRIGLDYAHDDTFDMDVLIERVANPFTVYGDPNSTAADSSDWNEAFVVEPMTHAEFKAKYKGAEPVDWEEAGYKGLSAPWFDDNNVMVAEYWCREEVTRNICRLSDGTIIDKEKLGEEYFLIEGVEVVEERPAKTWRVTQRILTGAEVLEENVWPGRYIPIVPVYGDEVNVEGKRYFRSLIRSAKDAQRQYNYWQTMATEAVALAPKAPYIGPVGAFETDVAKWNTANAKNHPFMEYDGAVPPQRQPMPEIPAAAIQQAISASDDMKSIMGMYDASLGARSNETSGKAILARQREGDVSTFHFADNMSRALRHAGRILIDLIPHVYSKERIIRVMGEDGTPDSVPLKQAVPVLGEDGQPQQEVDPATGQAVPVTRVYDLSAGKYDLTVTTGPSFTTRREEAANQMMQLMQAFPPAAQVLGDLLAKNLDWPGADEIAERLQKLLPPGAQGGPDPEIQKVIEEGKAQIEKLTAENQTLKQKADIEAGKLQVQMFEAQTDRMRAVAEINRPPEPPMAQMPVQ